MDTKDTDPLADPSHIDVLQATEQANLEVPMLVALIKDLAMDAAQAKTDAARLAGLLRATRRTRDYAFARTRSLHARCLRSERVLAEFIKVAPVSIVTGLCRWCDVRDGTSHMENCPYAIALDLVEHPAASDELAEIKEAREWLAENPSPSTSSTPSPASETPPA